MDEEDVIVEEGLAERARDDDPDTGWADAEAALEGFISGLTVH